MKSFILLFFFSAFSLSISAQENVPKTATDDTQSDFTVSKSNSWLDRFEKRQNKMIQFLGLTQPQKRSLDTLNDRFVTQRVLLQEDNTLNMRTRTAHLEIMRREREKKFREILTDAQLTKWNDMRKGQRKKAFRKK